MILRQARMFDSPQHVDLRSRGGVIHAIEPTGTLVPVGDEDVIDVDGRLVIPGLWDEHVHLGQWASHRRRIDVSAAASAEEALRLMAEGALARADDPVIVGAGMRPGTWQEEPQLGPLDARSGTVPWVIFSIDIHSCWANTAALQRFGYDSPTGVLTEHDSFALLGMVDAVAPTIHDRWVLEAEKMAASRGVVGVVDLDMGPTLDNWIRRRRGAEDSFAVRVEASVYPDTLDVAITRGLATGDEIAPGVTMGPLKAITDGSLNTKTAYVSTPYEGGGVSQRGTLNYTLEEVHNFVGRAHAAGLSVTLHAIGDRANSHMLDVFEAHAMRGRIEHAQLVSVRDIHRFAALGVTASVQPQHAVDDREVTDRFWSDRADRAFPLKSLLDAGAHVVFGSDAPVSPLDPWVQIAAAVTRTDDDRRPWHEEQTITIRQALACSTRNRVALGEPADLAVVDVDPVWLEGAFAGRPQELSRALRALPIALTVLGGRITHRGFGEDEWRG